MKEATRVGRVCLIYLSTSSSWILFFIFSSFLLSFLPFATPPYSSHWVNNANHMWAFQWDHCCWLSAIFFHCIIDYQPFVFIMLLTNSLLAVFCCQPLLSFYYWVTFFYCYTLLVCQPLSPLFPFFSLIGGGVSFYDQLPSFWLSLTISYLFLLSPAIGHFFKVSSV